jgi:ATP-dependent DNA helicase RecQ
MDLSTQFSRQLNLKTNAQRILHLIACTEEKYSSGYLVRLLRGDDTFGFHDPAHPDLPGFGTMADQHSDHLRNQIRYLLREEYLTVIDEGLGVLGLTVQGHAFLDSPTDLLVDRRSLRYNSLDWLYLTELRNVRRALSEQEGLPVYRIYNDYALQCLVETKPESVSELQQIPSLDDYKVNRYGPAILKALSRAREQQREENQRKLLRTAKNQSHRLTKTLFESGLTELEIADKRGLQPSTVRKQLITLHRTGEINLTPWIEETLGSEVLQKGSAYFQQAESRRLRDAYETLGLDYDTLRLCRLYVSQVSSAQTYLKSA